MSRAEWLAVAFMTTAALSCNRLAPACPRSPSQPSPPRLEHCLAPPWIPAAGAIPRLTGWTIENCGNPRSWGFVHEGARPISDEADPMFFELRDALLEIGTKAMVDLDAGDYWCAKQRDELFAIKLRIRLCGASIDDIVRRLAAVVNDRGLGDRRFGVDVFLSGQPGPRCERNDPRCGPESNGDDAGGRCRETTPITTGPRVDQTRGRCGHDGDCQITCESFCEAWTEQPCGKEQRPPNEAPAWCGCVEGKCAWLERRTERH